MKNTTLLFLVKKEDGIVIDICLAMKKRGFGLGRWNGAGGKLDEGEIVEQALVRETQEEIGVKPVHYQKIAEIDFHFRDQSDWDQKCHTYSCDKWEGEPSESEEMKPQWYKVDSIPFDSMWPDDIYWLPKVLENNLVQASFMFAPGDVILEQKIIIVDSFK
jgi:mutator protein MutT